MSNQEPMSNISATLGLPPELFGLKLLQIYFKEIGIKVKIRQVYGNLNIIRYNHLQIECFVKNEARQYKVSILSPNTICPIGIFKAGEVVAIIEGHIKIYGK